MQHERINSRNGDTPRSALSCASGVRVVAVGDPRRNPVDVRLDVHMRKTLNKTGEERCAGITD
jgi:hypothetical protein